MSLTISNLIILFMASIRISLLLAIDDGPFDVLKKLRRMIGVRHDDYKIEYGTNEFARMVLCPMCNSIWVGILLTILWFVYDDVVLLICLPLAMSQAVIWYNELV